MSKHTSRTQAALRHLQQIKPNEGWSIDSYVNSVGKHLVMLRRRNVPLHEKYFEEIILDSSRGHVIGKFPNENKGMVLVEKDGSVSRQRQVVSVSTSRFKGESAADDVNRGLEQQRREREKTRAAIDRQVEARNRSLRARENGELTDSQNAELLKYGMYVVAAAVFFRMFAAVACVAFFVILLPVGAYASFTVPSVESFDAKKELKRVLRGKHLPENHPDKPQGWFQKTAAKITASVVTETAALAGYTVEMLDFFGVARCATVRLNANNLECYWIGAFETWWFVYQREVESD
mmetsp:Transcript_31577/g.38619  ORF Transcript_31577/g.38619 Transcript_31577/m.38619 type:complete len:292 (-) Transcript_31577:364-1239(-)